MSRIRSVSLSDFLNYDEAHSFGADKCQGLRLCTSGMIGCTKITARHEAKEMMTLDIKVLWFDAGDKLRYDSSEEARHQSNVSVLCILKHTLLGVLTTLSSSSPGQLQPRNPVCERNC